MEYQQWDNDYFDEFVYSYLDAQNVKGNMRKGKMYDTPFGDLPYEMDDDLLVLKIYFDTREEAASLNDYVDAADCYDISFWDNVAFVFVIDI